MPPKNTSYGSTALTGLAMAATIAHEATDGVPIVKEVLGAVSSILKLAEKIEKDREALHALADKSEKLSRRITAVMEDRTANGEILQSLEGVRDVLHAVESLFKEFVSKTRIQRVVRYMFSIPRNVERLSAELEGALQEFLLIAALDTNIRVRENSRTIGPLRRLHDFEIEKLELVADVTSAKGSCMVKYHAARVEGAGRLFVVRYLQDAAVEGPVADAENLQRRLEEHDGILVQLSRVAKSHPNIAYLYGRSNGHLHNRFIVLRAGFIPLTSTILSPAFTLAAIWSMVPKLMDAALHLAQFGAVWFPDIPMFSDNVFVDERGEPTIGLMNDLQSSQSVAQHRVYEAQILMITTLLVLTCATVHDETASLDWSALLAGPESPYPQVMDAISAGRDLGCAPYTLHRSQLANLAPLNRTAQAYLTQLMSTFGDANPYATRWRWSQPMLRIVTRSVDRIGSGIYVEYRAASTAASWDEILVWLIADDGERVDHVHRCAVIPPERTREARQTLGIILPETEFAWSLFELVHVKDPALRSPADGQWVLREDYLQNRRD